MIYIIHWDQAIEATKAGRRHFQNSVGLLELFLQDWTSSVFLCTQGLCDDLHPLASLPPVSSHGKFSSLMLMLQSRCSKDISFLSSLCNVLYYDKFSDWYQCEGRQKTSCLCSIFYYYWATYFLALNISE